MDGAVQHDYFALDHRGIVNTHRGIVKAKVDHHRGIVNIFVHPPWDSKYFCTPTVGYIKEAG